MLAAPKTFWKHFPEQTAARGQALLQSDGFGFSGGQHGMSSAISSLWSAGLSSAAAGVTSGAVTKPAIQRIASNNRSGRQSFTDILSHKPRL